MFNYFFSYNVFNKKGEMVGSGNSEIFLKDKISSIQDVRYVSRFLEKKYNLSGIVIMNYREF